jgi:hypothetical protein
MGMTVVKATTVFDNLQNESFPLTMGIQQYHRLFDSFTSPPVPEQITALEFRLSGTASPGTLTASLFTESHYAPDKFVTRLGTLDDSLILPGPHNYSVALVDRALLAPSTRYWIVLQDTGDVEWNFSLDTHGIGLEEERFGREDQSFNNDSGPYQMRLTTAAVPAPDNGSTATLLGVGCLGLVLFQRHKHP